MMRLRLTMAAAAAVCLLVSASVSAQNGVRIRKGTLNATTLEFLAERGIEITRADGVAGGTLCTDCTVGTADCNGSVTGSLGEGDCGVNLGDDVPRLIDLYEITVSDEFDAIRIDWTSDDFDTVGGIIFDTGPCNEALLNDDCEAGVFGPSCLQGLIEPGTYALLVTSFEPANEGGTGDYEITVQCVKTPKVPVTTPWGAVALSLGLLAGACLVLKRQRRLGLDS